MSRKSTVFGAYNSNVLSNTTYNKNKVKHYFSEQSKSEPKELMPNKLSRNSKTTSKQPLKLKLFGEVITWKKKKSKGFANHEKQSNIKIEEI